jgi:hypothetical protein
VATLLRLKREGYKPDRDLILALTADEEGGGPYNGVDWLLQKHRELIDAEFALNEGARGMLVNGQRVENRIGLAGALNWLSTFAFEFRLTDITLAYFEKSAKNETGAVPADLVSVSKGDKAAMKRLGSSAPAMNAMMRTTCVATMPGAAMRRTITEPTPRHR